MKGPSNQENSPGGYHFWAAHTTALNEPLGPLRALRWSEEAHCKGPLVGGGTSQGMDDNYVR
jgi:hypothetical protein